MGDREEELSIAIDVVRDSRGPPQYQAVGIGEME